MNTTYKDSIHLFTHLVQTLYGKWRHRQQQIICRIQLMLVVS
jgi:hypothetical protein